MLIAVDHGNRQMKTENCEPFTSGLMESDTRPFGDNVLKYRGKYYQLSEKRIPYHRDKTADDKYFILTLFAIARELEAAGMFHSGVIPIQLAVGLPPAYYGAQKQAFIAYFSKRGAVTFTYRGKVYNIMITEVLCFPQSYAAAVTMFQELRDIPRALIVDLGGYTADYLQIRNGAGDLTVCDSLENGVILLYNKIIGKARAEHDLLVSEEEIDAVLMGKQADLPGGVEKLISDSAQTYIADLLDKLREQQIELKAGRIIFVGGGALLLRKQILDSGKVNQPVFVQDISANARGYALLYEIHHKGR